MDDQSRRHYLVTRRMMAQKNLQQAALAQDLPEVKYWLGELEQREKELYEVQKLQRRNDPNDHELGLQG